MPAENPARHFRYRIKAHPTKYKDILFRSRLEARWAAFFDLARWTWEYEPFDLAGWTPDFRIEFTCGHSDCPPMHSLLIEVKPYLSIAEFDGHPCRELACDYGETLPADAAAAFGNNPDVVYWEMAHGSGGGIETDLDSWIRGNDRNAWSLWRRAGNIVRYMPSR